MARPIPSLLLMLALAVAALALPALMRRSRARSPAPGVTLTPIASESGTAVRVELTNRGARPIHAPMVTLRPAPPGIRAASVNAVVPPGVARTPWPVRRLAPGATACVDLPCPLQPGETYTRVLGLAADAPEEAVYGLPIESLLALEIEWRTGHLPWSRRRRARLVRGAWIGPPRP